MTVGAAELTIEMPELQLNEKVQAQFESTSSFTSKTENTGE